ncbi:universal stress protein [Texcoconibacillus texcoconensis]|uniref:Nucleotide-binding universal stress UspA family protein n=1 Tax=Texcoconibacillus texcoconensis TaxID=1095777 RepID=A0A840QT34_9BACI|nr:universal stress protein [Texcoconibacillus texcoconensis]MBB5174525.1 nucleotide-binding universal stress UspA family protein [Texcoconibacillus texcoconensis]
MFEHILVAADGSSHSLEAAKKGVDIAKTQTSCFVTIVHVVDEIPSHTDVMGMDFEPRDWPTHRKERVRPVEELFEQHSVNFKTKHLYGEPGPTIVSQANQSNVDLVVIGSRGLNPLQQMVLGSVSHKVAKRAQCPVMIVKKNK